MFQAVFKVSYSIVFQAVWCFEVYVLFFIFLATEQRQSRPGAEVLRRRTRGGAYGPARARDRVPGLEGL